MRLHELAKKHGYNQQDLLTAVQKKGFDVKDPLAVVDAGLEKWVADKASDGWIPSPPEKKTIKKKKVVAVKSPAASRPADASAPEEVPAAPVEELPPAVHAPGPESAAETKIGPPLPAPADASPARTETPDVSAPAAEADSSPPEAPREERRESKPARTDKGVKIKKSRPEPETEKPAEAKPPVVVKRIGTTVKGSAAVGQASPEMIAAIKRNLTGSGKPAPADASRQRPSGGPPGRGPRPPAPRGGPAPRVEVVPSDADMSGKPSVKRLKTKSRPTQEVDDREVAEKKAKLAKRSRSRDEDWGIDDDSGEYEAQPQEEAPRSEASSNTQIIESIASGLLSPESDDGRASAGFKHKRADFKSKRMQHELPASFAEIDNEYTRSIASGGRRRSGRNAHRRGGVGRRSRTRRILAPVPRVAGQEALVRLGMTLRDLSIAMGVKVQDILGYMLGQGAMLQVNDILNEEQIGQIAENFKIPLKWDSDEDLEQELADEAEQQSGHGGEAGLVERPPVVTFMGHVDHGKTSLLDAIRHTRVVDGEHGGITQHIGAYSVVRNNKRVSFLDTPGHEAFSAMRARGANLTDIAVLVVAADDGVMPQTEEAAAHAKNAGVPIVIAINKCDLPAANPDRVRQELANRLGLLPEEWGGTVGMVQVSAHTREGIDDLVERVLLEAEVLELRANPKRPATGFVVEAKMSEGQGVVATLLVSDGTLRNGDVILCSNGYGKIRFMFDEFGKPIAEAGPGAPVRMSGLSAVPDAGDRFFILSDILKARAIAEQRERESRAAAMAKRQHVTLENLTTHLAGSGKRELSVIVKADVVGSLEVIEKELRKMATSEVGIDIIHSAVGGINHADVILADASDALILGFHVGVENQARLAATNLGVQVKTYHIIYRMTEDMHAALEGLLPPEEKEVVQGHVEIRQVFRSSKIGAIAGCYVTDGLIQRTSRARIFRNQVMIYDGTIQSLRRVKDDAREVKAGFECGIKIANYDAIEEGDVIEAYSIEEVARKL